jgi:VIT1/CCC1 family predicted Fe2+/Mn2+ transporter
MADKHIQSSKRILDPFARAAEVLCGLIMVVTFTNSLSVARAGRGDVDKMLLAALGCNLARGRQLRMVHAVRETTDPENAARLIANALPSVVAAVLQPAELAAVHQRLKQLMAPPRHASLRKRDWLGAGAVFLLVFTATFPPVVPFIFMHNAVAALRVSNVVAMGGLFLVGYLFGRRAGRNPWWMGIIMLTVGGILMGIAMALGG